MTEKLANISEKNDYVLLLISFAIIHNISIIVQYFRDNKAKTIAKKENANCFFNSLGGDLRFLLEKYIQ
jgi:hypothetical protein